MLFICLGKNIIMGETQSGKFHALDYIVIAITLLVSVSIGVYFWFTGGKQKIIQVMVIFVLYHFIYPLHIVQRSLCGGSSTLCWDFWGNMHRESPWEVFIMISVAHAVTYNPNWYTVLIFIKFSICVNFDYIFKLYTFCIIQNLQIS